MRVMKTNGFTLIEVVLVIVILGILFAFAIPKISVQSFAANGAMQSVGTSLLAAQRLATARQHNLVVGFDTVAGALRILDDSNNNGIADPGEHVRVIALDNNIVFGLGGAPPMGNWTKTVTFTKKTLGSLPAVTFHRDGSASEAGAIYLTTPRAQAGSGYATDTRVIQIDRATARVEWFRASPPNWVRGF